MKWIKAAIVGLLGSLVMYVLIILGINAGIAPFNITPSAAFLLKIGLPAKPLALIVHFVYGAFWSLLLVYWFNERTDIKKGVGLALIAWLIMMVIYSPIIGWGFFGFGDAHTLNPSDPLFLQTGPKYIISTLVLHLIFGTIIGWINPKWINFSSVEV